MPQLSIIVPTFNEAENVVELRDRLQAALAGVDWEVIFVDDDSPDGTDGQVLAMAQRDRRVRRVLRIGRRGLATACIEGMLAASAPLVAVIDADLQHDETRLPAMLEMLRDSSIDVVVGSRYAPGGSVGAWAAPRERLSRAATWLAQHVLKAQLHDPMSGFFMIRREAVERCVRAGLSGVGFKILLDLFATSPRPLRYREVPYTFAPRLAGQSKLDANVAWEFLVMLIDRFFGRLLPVRFIAFSLVGAAGLGVHMAVVALALQGMGAPFLFSQAGATLVAMCFNFALNNLFTYRDMRLRGWDMWRGLLSFSAACSIGALANVGIAQALYQRQTAWALSAIAGVMVGAVWNYAVTAVYTWKRKPARASVGAVQARPAPTRPLPAATRL